MTVHHRNICVAVMTEEDSASHQSLFSNKHHASAGVNKIIRILFLLKYLIFLSEIQ